MEVTRELLQNIGLIAKKKIISGRQVGETSSRMLYSQRWFVASDLQIKLCCCASPFRNMLNSCCSKTHKSHYSKISISCNFVNFNEILFFKDFTMIFVVVVV